MRKFGTQTRAILHGGPPFFSEAHPPGDLRAIFTGRAEELRNLDAMLARANGAPVVVVGIRGSGRTALCRAYIEWRGNRYRGVIFCSSQQFVSADALIDYVAYERAELAARTLVPTHETRDGRPLVLIDDADKFRPREIASVLALAQSRPPGIVPLLTSRSQFASLDPFGTPVHELRLRALRESDIEALLAKHVASETGSRERVEDFLAAVHREGLRMDQLTPRIALELFYGYGSLAGGLKEAISELATRSTAPSNIVVFEHEGRLRAAPALQGEPTGLVDAAQPPLLAAPYIVIPHLAAIWRGQLEEFDELLADPGSCEGAFQSFFEANPHFLQGIEYSRIVAHPSLIREGDGPLIPDFMLQPLNLRFANILDLKRPDAKLVTGRKDRRHFAHSVHEAIAQVREYREYFERLDYRHAVEERYGITAYRPSALIVIGRQPEAMSEEEMKRIEADVPSFVKIQTYDDVLRTMRQMVELKES